MDAIIAGYGHMGHLHHKVLTDLGYQATTVDPDPATGAHHATITQATRAHGHPPIAVIATPIPHLTHTATQLAPHAALMLIEKPYATNPQEARQLTQTLKQHHVRAHIGYTERFNPTIHHLTQTHQGQHHQHIHYTRHNTKPSTNPALDLQTHDIDLHHHTLHPNQITSDTTSYSTKANHPTQTRTITLTHHNGTQTTHDLTHHNTSPLHRMWHAILQGHNTPCTPNQATQVLHHLQRHDPHT